MLYIIISLHTNWILGDNNWFHDSNLTGEKPRRFHTANNAFDFIDRMGEDEISEYNPIVTEIEYDEWEALQGPNFLYDCFITERYF